MEFLKKKHNCENEEDIAIIEVYLTSSLANPQGVWWTKIP